MPAQDDEYELMPRNELEYLRKEVEKLKRNPLGDTQASISLLDSINKLNANIVQLNNILASANDDMVKAFNDSSLQEQIRKLGEQQEKLAKGIVAVAELVKKVESERTTPLPSLDTMIPKPSPVAAVPVGPGPMPVMPEPMQQHNPFEEAGYQHHDPILHEPLPRPGTMPPGAIPPSAVPQQFAMPPQAGQQSGPNPFIPDADIPPPPPRRR